MRYPIKQKIFSIDDLAITVDNLKKAGKRFVLRGQPDEDKALLPSIARDGCVSSVEIKIFEEFKKDVADYLSNRAEISSANDDFEKITLGRHYCLKTRCLDWTQDTNVALFFAVEDNINNSGENGVVWVYDLTPYNPSEWLLLSDRFEKNPFELEGIKIFHPKTFQDFRTDKQKSLVTIHSYPWKPMEELVDNKRLIKILVPACSKRSMRDELNKRYAINHDSLFSKESKAKELENICMAINSKYSAMDQKVKSNSINNKS